MRDPQEKPPDQQKAEIGLSRMGSELANLEY